MWADQKSKAVEKFVGAAGLSDGGKGPARSARHGELYKFEKREDTQQLKSRGGWLFS